LTGAKKRAAKLTQTLCKYEGKIMEEGILCTHCKEKTIFQINDIEGSVGMWQCRNCGELRYWCPACDQGWVVHGIIKKDNTSIRLCEECESMWFSSSKIGTTDCFNFVDYMRSKGLSGVWEEIEVLRDIH
jgi:hypothetical protein